MVNFIVDVFAFNVIPDVEEDHNVELAPVSSHVHDPIVSVRDIVHAELKSFIVTLKLFALNVHCVRIRPFVVMIIASCNVIVPPGAFILINFSQVNPAFFNV